MGTKQGGFSTAETNRKKHGADFYKKIGAMGGKKSRGGGFSNREVASKAGKIGGAISRRPRALVAC